MRRPSDKGTAVSQRLSGFFASLLCEPLCEPGLPCYRQAFLGAAWKYSSRGMSDTPPYHFWSQMCSTHIFMKNHSYWRGHFLMPGCLQEQGRSTVNLQLSVGTPQPVPGDPPISCQWEHLTSPGDPPSLGLLCSTLPEGEADELRSRVGGCLRKAGRCLYAELSSGVRL